MAVEFSPETNQKIEELLSRYPTKTSATLPILWVAQRECGYLSKEIVEHLAGLLEINPIRLQETISFYTMFQTKPLGKYLIQVCHTLSCSLRGAGNIANFLKDKLKIDFGKTTPDNKFTLVKVECLGSCGTAPVVQINDDYYENVTIEELDRILDNLP